MNQNNRNQFLMPNNENRVKSYIMTELSKSYNIQPMLKTIDTKISQIMKHIFQTVSVPRDLSINDGIEYLNKITIEQSINGFADILKPYTIKSASSSNEQLNSDVNNEYEKLMKEREYTNSNLSVNVKSVQNAINEISNSESSLYDELLGNYNNMTSGLDSRLTSIPEVLDISERKNNFNERIMEMKMNRNKMIEERNLVDLEKIKKNSEQQMGYYRPVENTENNSDNQNNLEVKSVSYDNVNEVSNIGTELVEKKLLEQYRYDEYKTNMKYKTFDRQFLVNSKDRRWYGDIENNTINPGLEPYRYRFGINNNKTSGIYLQNRQKNVSAIRITTVYISMNELDTAETGYMPPYIYVYIPELENRIETSNINRKFIFTVLTLDDRLNGQLKYINFISANYYLTNPIADLSNMTIEILNPLGHMYSDSKDNLKIKSMDIDNQADPKSIILTLDKYVKRTQYNRGDIVIIKNYGVGLVDTFTNFMNRETGHFIKSNPSTDEFVDKIYIDVPKKANPNGLYVIQPFFQDIIQLIINNQNPYALTEGNIINTNLQPVVIFEISRLEPNSKGLSQSHITII
jgi:hypothetical protein